MDGTSILPPVIFRWGPLVVESSVVITWILMAVMALASWLMTRTLRIQAGTLQTLLESVLSAMDEGIHSVLPTQTRLVFPFLATLWIFIVTANLVGLFPGLDSPTARLDVTASLAVLVFLSVHWFGIRAEGIKNYLAHYIRPNPFLLPFHIISEISRTLALAVRLFGNIMSLELAAFLVLLVAGFLVPVPILMLHIVEAVIQAYLFGMLALIYIAGGVQTQELRKQKKEGIAHE